MASNPNQHGGLYVHIPFCLRKCPYCDFYSVTDSSRQRAFVRALLAEMTMANGVPFSFDTLYIGGGTPSLFDAPTIRRIIGAARESHRLLPDAEITIEANPGTVDPAQLQGFREAGINRISIGVQSFQDARLRFLGRIHSQRESHQAVRWSRDAGFENLGIDLVYGTPDQTGTSWRRDLQEAVGLEPEHLSCYTLTYEPGTPMDEQRRTGAFAPMEEGLVADLFDTTVDTLAAGGYEQYEISNFERSDPLGQHANRSRHNQKYWSYAPYLGLGPSAHSFVAPVRRWNVGSLERYIAEVDSRKLPLAETETLTREQQMVEWVYLGLRQADGIPVEDFNRRFGADFHSIFGDILTGLRNEGLVKTDDRSCALTRRGMLLLDSIVERFLISDF